MPKNPDFDGRAEIIVKERQAVLNAAKIVEENAKETLSYYAFPSHH